MTNDLTAGAPPEPPEPFPDAPAAVGDVLLDRWSVSEIHRGGQAWVLVVDDIDRGERRAVKLPLSGVLAGDAELVMLLGLDPHPHVVMALDVAEIGGRRGLVLEYAPATFADLLRQHLSMPSQRYGSVRRAVTTDTGATRLLIPRAELLQEICDGMAHLSEVGEFAHLDLKPSNVLIDSTGCAKIADFGMARPISIRDGRYSSASGGTWAYAAPEVLRKEPCDSRADIFSFGVLLYEAWRGKLPYPFRLASDPDAQRAQLLDYYDSLDDWGTVDLDGWDPSEQDRYPSRDIRAIISSCLQQYMNERPRSFGDLAEMLAQHLDIPRVRATAVPLPEMDRQRRELALSQALIRLGRFNEAVRRLNRLLSTALPPALSMAVLQSAQEALIDAGRPDEAAALQECDNS